MDGLRQRVPFDLHEILGEAEDSGLDSEQSQAEVQVNNFFEELNQSAALQQSGRGGAVTSEDLRDAMFSDAPQSDFLKGLSPVAVASLTSDSKQRFTALIADLKKRATPSAWRAVMNKANGASFPSAYKRFFNGIDKGDLAGAEHQLSELAVAVCSEDLEGLN
jgi:hypothetical protein